MSSFITEEEKQILYNKAPTYIADAIYNHTIALETIVRSVKDINNKINAKLHAIKDSGNNEEGFPVDTELKNLLNDLSNQLIYIEVMKELKYPPYMEVIERKCKKLLSNFTNPEATTKSWWPF